MLQKQRIKTILDINNIPKNLNESGLTEEEKKVVSQVVREKKFNLRSRVKSVNFKAELCRNQREYEEKTRLSIPQIVDFEYKQCRQYASSVKHRNKFTAVFSIRKPQYHPSIVYGVQNNKTMLGIKDILRKI